MELIYALGCLALAALCFWGVAKLNQSIEKTETKKLSTMNDEELENYSKKKESKKVENAPIKVGDQVIAIKGRGRVKKGTKGICTHVNRSLGSFVYTIIYDTGFAIGNKPNPVTLSYTELQRSYSFVKINN